MSRLEIPQRSDAPETTHATLDAVEKQLGTLPNLFRLLANSPAALNAYTGLHGALGRTLDVKTRERIALAVAQVNGCDYCLSAHAYLGQHLARLDAEEIARNRRGHSADRKADAAVRFAASVARERGHVDDAAIAAIREAGYDDAQIVEIVALVAENCFTNFLNEVARTDIDFPVVLAADAA
ncbi:MAG: carboxymuconolactone decarboxylase family protein [Gammaproteobacteria bacterium]